MAFGIDGVTVVVTGGGVTVRGASVRTTGRGVRTGVVWTLGLAVAIGTTACVAVGAGVFASGAEVGAAG